MRRGRNTKMNVDARFSFPDRRHSLYSEVYPGVGVERRVDLAGRNRHPLSPLIHNDMTHHGRSARTQDNTESLSYHHALEREATTASLDTTNNSTATLFRIFESTPNHQDAPYRHCWRRQRGRR